MDKLQQYVINRYNIFCELLGGGTSFYNKLGDEYGKLSEAHLGGLGEAFIKKREETYKLLLNPIVIELGVFLYENNKFSGSDKYPKLGFLMNKLKSGEYDASTFNIDTSNNVSIQNILNAINLPDVENIIDGIDLDNPESGENPADLKADFMSGSLEEAFGFNEDDKDLENLANELNDETNENPDSDLEDFLNELNGDTTDTSENGQGDTDNLDAGGDIDFGVDDDAKPEPKKDLEFDDEPKSEAELFEFYDKAWGGLLNKSIGNLMARLNALYASGFSGLVSEPWGLLTNQGVIKAYSSKKFIGRRANSDNASDVILYRALIDSIGASAIGGNFNGFRGIGENRPNSYVNPSTGVSEPYNELMNSSKIDLELLNNPYSEIFYNFHAKICFGYFKTCDGLAKYIKENDKGKLNIDYSRATRVPNYKALEGYIKHEIKKIAYYAYREAGISNDSVDGDLITKVNNINDRIITAMKNAVIIPEQKKDVYTEIRISMSHKIDLDTLIENLSDKLGQKVERIKQDQSGVIAIRVVYNEKAANETSLFAKDTLDGILATGQTMSWSHALLGKNLQGEALFWDDFKDDKPSKRVYCVYAESRAGKGIMTTTLLCNALSNGYKLIYIDGKPENGVGTGKIAWSDGKEAAIYNGFNKMAEPYNQPLEAYTGGLRTIDQAFVSLDKIPEGIFKVEKDKEQFIALCTYIRGIELVCRLIGTRSSQVGKSPDDWVVAVFDEFRQLAVIEKRMRDIFVEYLSERGVKIDSKLGKPIRKQSDGKKADPFDDPGVAWITSWYEWLSNLAALVSEAVTMSIGKANINLFFIFQGSDWMGTEGAGTFLCDKVLLKLDSTKIIGRQGVSGKGGDTKYGNGIAANYSWVQYLNAHPGTWAITKTASVGGCQNEDSVYLFRPFNVYLEPKSNAEQIYNAPDDDPDIGQEKYKYIGPYISKMLNAIGSPKSAADILNEAFVYANDFVKSSGLANNIHEFMYNAHDFGLGNISEGNGIAGVNGASGHLYDAPDQDGEPQTNGNGQQGNQGNGSASASDKFTALNQAGLEAVQHHNSQDTYNSNVNNKFEELNRQFEAEIIGQPQENQQQQPTFDLDPFDLDPQSNQQDTMFNQQFDQFDQGQQEGQGEIPPGMGCNPQGKWVNAGCETVNNTGNPSSYRFGDRSEGFVTFFTTSDISSALNLTPDNSYIVTVADHRGINKSHKLMQTLRGADYELKSRWLSILKAVGMKQNLNSITSAVIFNGALIFNKRQVAACGLIGGEDGVEVRDIVNFSETAKRMPNITTLSIDLLVRNAVVAELGENPEIALFEIFNRLNIIKVYSQTYGNPPTIFTRSEINSEKQRRQLEMKNAETTLRNGIDTISNASNPRLDKATPIQKHRVYQTSSNLTRGGWESCKKNFKDGHYVRTSIILPFTILGTFVTGGLFGISRIRGLMKH